MRIVMVMAMAAALAPGAQAQIRLPITVPALPLSSVSQTLAQTESRTLDTLSEVRRLQISHLLRDKRIEADPDGNPIVRGEILAVGADEATLARLSSRGYTVDRQSVAAELRVVVLKVPAGLATKRALRELREADPAGLYDYNHIYLGVGAADETGPKSAPPLPANSSKAPLASPGLRVGLVDSGVDATHPAFRDSPIHPWGCGGRQVPAAHGTEVASLLVMHGAAEVFAADVYCGAPTGGAADAIVASLGWLSQQGIAVINVSLVGPRNALLERIVAALIARGHLIVAAVGNDGPAAAPLYPASYPDVVGVTAVDAHRHVLIEAGRGPQVMFAAPGADIRAASLDHQTVAVRGTSFAAPTVTALLAALLPSPERRAAELAVESLARQAIHLGSSGKDLTYGLGLVGAENR
jgi:subtilisin family serine protease